MAKRNVRSIQAALARTNKPMEPRAITVGDGLENVVAGLGTSRDKRSYSNYNFCKPLLRYEAENMWRSSHVAKRIVMAPADDMTREWREFELEEDDDSNKKLFEQLEEEEKKLCVQHKFREALYWSRLYGGALIILGLADAVNPLDMLTPLDVTKVKKGDLKYIHVIDRWRCAPSGKITQDIMDPNFGKPESYILAESTLEIHHTRVLRFNGQKLPYFAWMANGMWDDSELQHVYDSVINYDTAMHSVGSMLFEANIDVVSPEGLTDLLATASGEAKLLKRFQLGQMMKSFNRTLILDSKETYEKKHNTFSNIDAILREYKADVSGASQIALSILFGEQAAGLQSGGDDDLRNYYDFVVKERSAKVDQQLDYFDQIFVRHVLGTMPTGYKSSWKSLWKIDDADQAQVDYQNAQRDQIYLSTGVASEGLIAQDLKRRGTYPTMSTDDVELAQELAEKMDDFDDGMRDQQLNPPDDAKPAKPAAKQKRK